MLFHPPHTSSYSGKRFARIQDSFGIELVLDVAHQAQGCGVDLSFHESAFQDTHAVLAGNRALELDYQREQGVQAAIGLRHLVGLVRIYEEIDV
jgi:hypothetical protein